MRHIFGWATRSAIQNLPVWLILALMVAACAPGAPAAPDTEPTVAPILESTSSAPELSGNTTPTAASSSGSLPAGIDADGNFYRGDPSATVKLIEFSDFQ